MLFISCHYFWDLKNFPATYLEKMFMIFTNWKLRGKKGMSQLKLLFQNIFLIIFFQDKMFTGTSPPLNPFILKIWHTRMNRMSCSIRVILWFWKSPSVSIEKVVKTGGLVLKPVCTSIYAEMSMIFPSQQLQMPRPHRSIRPYRTFCWHLRLTGLQQPVPY